MYTNVFIHISNLSCLNVIIVIQSIIVFMIYLIFSYIISTIVTKTFCNIKESNLLDISTTEFVFFNVQIEWETSTLSQFHSIITTVTFVNTITIIKINSSTLHSLLLSLVIVENYKIISLMSNFCLITTNT